MVLDPSLGDLYIGRNEGSTVRVETDQHVSGRHARLIYGGGAWSIEDAGSRNGTTVNGKDLIREAVLEERMLITVGHTLLSFHAPAVARVKSTAPDVPITRTLSPNSTQHKVLVELTRPWFTDGDDVPAAPSNSEIAARLHLAPPTVRDAISELYHHAGLTRSAGRQREALVRLAIAERVVTRADYT